MNSLKRQIQKHPSIGVIGCKILRSNDYISFLASTLILALLSLDRFGLICFAQNSLVKRLLRISWLKCVACLLLSMLFALPMIIFAKWDSTNGECIVRFPDQNKHARKIEFSANMTDLNEIGYCHKTRFSNTVFIKGKYVHYSIEKPLKVRLEYL